MVPAPSHLLYSEAWARTKLGLTLAPPTITKSMHGRTNANRTFYPCPRARCLSPFAAFAPAISRTFANTAKRRLKAIWWLLKAVWWLQLWRRLNNAILRLKAVLLLAQMTIPSLTSAFRLKAVLRRPNNAVLPTRTGPPGWKPPRRPAIPSLITQGLFQSHSQTILNTHNGRNDCLAIGAALRAPLQQLPREILDFFRVLAFSDKVWETRYEKSPAFLRQLGVLGHQERILPTRLLTKCRPIP